MHYLKENETIEPHLNHLISSNEPEEFAHLKILAAFLKVKFIVYDKEFYPIKYINVLSTKVVRLKLLDVDSTRANVFFLNDDTKVNVIQLRHSKSYKKEVS